MLDGAFPDYERVIPENNTKELIVNKQDFIAAVDRVSTLSSDRTRAIKFKLLKKSRNYWKTLIREVPKNINVHYDGDDLEIGFNSKYLIDIARQISGKY